MSNDDIFSSLLNALRHSDNVAEQLLHGGRDSPLSQLAQANLLDRATMVDRRFWTGAALGAAAVLVITAAKTNRSRAGGVKDSDAPSSTPPARKANGLC